LSAFLKYFFAGYITALKKDVFLPFNDSTIFNISIDDDSLRGNGAG
jgi:hypothetical protein